MFKFENENEVPFWLERVPEVRFAEIISAVDGRKYYANTEDNTTSWEVPDEYKHWRNNALNAFLKNTSWRRVTNIVDG